MSALYSTVRLFMMIVFVHLKLYVLFSLSLFLGFVLYGCYVFESLELAGFVISSRGMVSWVL